MLVSFFKYFFTLSLFSTVCAQDCASTQLLPAAYRNPTSFSFTPDGNYITIGMESIAAGNYGPVVFQVTDTAVSNDHFYDTTVHPGKIAFSPDGTLLATAEATTANPGQVGLYTVTNGVLGNVTAYSIPSIVSDSDFSPDSKYLAVACRTTNNVRIFQVVNNQLVNGIAYAVPAGSLYPISIAFSPQGDLLATANDGSNDISLFNVANGAITNGVSYPLPFGSINAKTVAFSPDGKYVAASNYLSGPSVSLYTVENGALINGKQYSIDGIAGSVAFSPNSKYLVASNMGTSIPSITIFTVNNGDLVNRQTIRLPAGTQGSGNAIFTPDGQYIALYFINAGKYYFYFFPITCYDSVSSSSSTLEIPFNQGIAILASLFKAS